ncbi:MAG: hypothetical protein WDW38_001720 [Sanguina aurantia]
MEDIVIPKNATWFRAKDQRELLRTNAALETPNQFVAVEGHNIVHVMPMNGAPEAVSGLKQQLGIAYPTPYLAIHLRLGRLHLGGMHGEIGPVYHSMEVKNMILEGTVLNATTTKVTPVFTAVFANADGLHGKVPSERDQVSTIADMGILAGLGDRLRGIELMVRAAMASKRVLLVDIPHPIPFTSLFAPASLDWRMGSIVVPDDAVWWRGDTRVGLLQSNAALQEPSKFVAVEGHNQIHILPVRNAPDMEWVGLAAHCTFRSLFRPSQQVQKAITVRQYQLGVPLPKRYLAVHIRLEGVQGEAGKAYLVDPLETLRHSLRCARSMVAARSHLQTTLVVVTDSTELKHLILEGSLRNTSTTRILPLLTAATGSTTGLDEDLFSEAQMVNTVADMGILAGATCMVSEYGSGFSTHARLWGGGPSLWGKNNACFRSTMECIKEGGGGDQAEEGAQPFQTYSSNKDGSRGT